MFDSYSATFEERASSYHQAMMEVPDAREAEFRAVIAPIENESAGIVCDMPSGGCYLAAYLPSRMRYVGVEPVAQFRAASGAAKEHVLPADLASVPLPDFSVDHVLSLAGLHHEKNLEPIFREMRRLVRREGVVVISDVAAKTAPANFLNGFVARHNPQGHDGAFLDQSTTALLKRAGLAIVEDQLVEVPWLFASRDQAGDFCRKLFGIVGLDRPAIVDALEREIGLSDTASGASLQWTLRRIVCRPG
jgi:SAM-dependent methyltransferase